MNLPIPEYGKTDKETIQNLMDTVMRLRKELEYVLHHLGDENIPELAGIKGDINSNYTAISQTESEITLLAADVSGNTSAINIQAGQISSIVSSVSGLSSSISIQAGQIQSISSDVSGMSSSITQLSNNINLKVDKSGVISAINLSPESITLSASRINLTGVTTMNGLAYVADTLTLGTGSNNGRLNFKVGTSIYAEELGIVFNAAWAEMETSLFLVNGSLQLTNPSSHNLVAKFG